MSTATSSPPTSENVRLTISVTPEVHAAFQRLAAAQSMSLSRCMGDWLGDTLEGVEYMANLVEKARATPKMVVRELHGYALGLADETGALMRSLAAKGRAGSGSGGAAHGAGTALPPSSNTGGKVTPASKRQGPTRKARK